MLKQNNDINLRQKGVDDIYILFCQTWQELVHGYTLDVYQYRVLNSLSAIVELESVLVKTIEGLFNTNHNVDACKEEILQILKNDIVIEKYNKPLLNRLQNHIGKKSEKMHELKALCYHIRYAIKELSPVYLEHLFHELKNEIDNNDAFLIEKHANAIVSQCVNLGWSSKALFSVLNFFSSVKSKDIKWLEFKKELTKPKEKYIVLLSVFFKPTGERDIILSSLADMGIFIKEYSQLTNEYFDIANIHTILKNDKKYIHVEVDAMDVYSAANTAIRIVSDKINMASFYKLITAWDLNTLTIISINQRNHYTKNFTSKELYTTNDYIDISGNIFESTRRIFSNNNKSNITEKLNGAFGYANISRASLFQEEKYMNMWVALESLARTDMYPDIITNVKEVLPAVLCIRYIYRIVRNFAEDCIRCNVDFNFSTASVDLNQGTKRKMVKEIIAIFQDDALSNELKSNCSVNGLLLFRFNSVKQLVSDVGYAAKKIENHYKQVKWQIQRLYRIRNEIAHSALQNETSLIIYIEHLFDYLSAFITEIITCLDYKGLSSLEEAFCVIKDNYDAFIELYKKGEISFIKSNILDNGIIDLLVLE